MPYFKHDPSFGGKRWTDTNFDVGDIVKKAGGSGADSLSRFEEYVVQKIEYVYSTDTHYQDGVYNSVYRQKITVSGGNRAYFGSNFKIERKVGAAMALEIENMKPCVAVEIDTNAAGEDTIKEPAVWLPFDTPLKAKAALSKIISDDIRENNVYRRFRLYTNSVVAGAKQPEIEFK